MFKQIGFQIASQSRVAVQQNGGVLLKLIITVDWDVKSIKTFKQIIYPPPLYDNIHTPYGNPILPHIVMFNTCFA